MQNKLLLHNLTYSRKSNSRIPSALTPRSYSSDAVKNFQNLLSEADDTTPEGKELFAIWDLYEEIYAKHKQAQRLLGAEAIEEDENGEDINSDGEEEDEGPNEYDFNDDFINDGEIDKTSQKKTTSERQAELNTEIELIEKELERLRAKRAKVSKALDSDDVLLIDD